MLIIMLIIDLQLNNEENYENCAQARAGVILYRLSRLLRQLKPLQFPQLETAILVLSIEIEKRTRYMFF